MSNVKELTYYGIVCKDTAEAQKLGQMLRQLGANANQYQGRCLIVGPTTEELTLFGYEVEVVEIEVVENTYLEDCMVALNKRAGHKVPAPAGFVASRIGLDSHTEHGDLVAALERAKSTLTRIYEVTHDCTYTDTTDLQKTVDKVEGLAKPYWEARQ